MYPGIFPCDVKNKYFKNLNSGDVSEIFSRDVLETFLAQVLETFRGHVEIYIFQ